MLSLLIKIVAYGFMGWLLGTMIGVAIEDFLRDWNNLNKEDK